MLGSFSLVLAEFRDGDIMFKICRNLRSWGQMHTNALGSKANAAARIPFSLVSTRLIHGCIMFRICVATSASGTCLSSRFYCSLIKAAVCDPQTPFQRIAASKAGGPASHPQLVPLVSGGGRGEMETPQRALAGKLKADLATHP